MSSKPTILNWIWNELMERLPTKSEQQLGDYAEHLVLYGPESEQARSLLGEMDIETQELAEVSERLWRALREQ